MVVRSSRRHRTRRLGSGTAAENGPDNGADNGVVVSIAGRARAGASSTRIDSDRSMWMDRWVRDSGGAALGVTVAVLRDAVTHRAVWLAVYTGVPNATIVVVPVCGSSLLGDDIVIAADRDSVLAAPTIELEARLDPAQERDLSDHLRRQPGAAAGSTRPSDQRSPSFRRLWP
jgi:hypothetical protein